MKWKMTLGLFLSLTLILSGCWDKRELNELAIVVAMGIDKVDDEYEISLQVVDPHEVAAKQGTSGRSPVVTYHARGKSIFEAIRRSTTVTPRKPYFSHIQMLIIGKDLANYGISDALDLLSRDNEFRSDFNVIVADETTAKEVLGIYTPLEKIPASKMYNSIEVSEKVWAPTASVQIHKLITELSKKEKNAILTVIRITGDPEIGSTRSNVERIDSESKLKYSGLAVFKQDKLAGILSEEESKGYNYIHNNVKSTIGIIPCPNGDNLSVEVTNSKTKVTSNMKNGVPSIDVDIKMEQNVGEVNCSIDLTKEKTIAYLNKESEALIKKIVQNTIETFQQGYQIDVLGFGDTIHRNHPKEWKKIKDDWVELFPNVKVNLSVDIKTTGVGTTLNSTIHEEKE